MCMHKYSTKLHQGGGVEAASRSCRLPSAVCNALQPCLPTCMHHGGFSWQVDCVFCALDLNFIQMRIKWPRLFKECACSVDLNKQGRMLFVYTQQWLCGITKDGWISTADHYSGETPTEWTVRVLTKAQICFSYGVVIPLYLSFLGPFNSILFI